MSEVKVGIVVGVAVGIAAAHIGTATVRRLTEQIHNEELEDARREGYQDGWTAASNNPVNIRNRFRDLFGSTDVKEGTSLKG